jgi:hypothetical protein
MRRTGVIPSLKPWLTLLHRRTKPIAVLDVCILKALRAVIGRLPDSLLAPAVELAVEAGDEEALAELVPRLQALPLPVIYSSWKWILHRFTSEPWEGRPPLALLSTIRFLAPVIAALGGSEAAVQMTDVLDDIGRWWP